MGFCVRNGSICAIGMGGCIGGQVNHEGYVKEGKVERRVGCDIWKSSWKHRRGKSGRKVVLLLKISTMEYSSLTILRLWIHLFMIMGRFRTLTQHRDLVH